MVGSSRKEEKTVSIAIIAIVAALGVLGVVILLAVMTIPLQEAEARGCENSVQSGSGNGLISANASKGRCFGH
jgi:hypothetical protein